MRILPLMMILALCGFTPGCGPDDGMSTDDASMREDAASDDGSVRDAGSDAGDDVGTEDASAPDASMQDASTDDLGSQDDLGTQDDASVDAGTPDLGTPDAGTPDSGMEDPCELANGGCDPLTSCVVVDDSPVCGACPEGYLGTGVSGCEVDACAEDNGGCGAHRPCVSGAGVAMCGACEAGYMEDGMGGCEPLLCDPFTSDTLEPDSGESPITVAFGAEATVFQRSLTPDDHDAFDVFVPVDCQLDVEWAHDGATASAAEWTMHLEGLGMIGMGPLSAHEPFSFPAAPYDLRLVLVVDAKGLCVSYILSFELVCPVE